ncbi:MAG: CARDB domain-containing protein [Myxococcota bacterium]
MRVSGRQCSWFVVLFAFCSFFAACGSCDDSPGGGAGGDGGVDAADTSDTEPGDAADSDGATMGDADSDADAAETDVDTWTCPEERQCGGTCCDSGQECLNGQCLDPCSGTRCGENLGLCCTGEDVCIYDACTTPGDDCQSTFQCPDDEYCEETLGKCLPQDAIGDACQYQPPVGQFSPAIEDEFLGFERGGRTYDKSITAPIVADVDNDGIPEIVVLFYRGGLNGAAIGVINGDDMSLLASGGVEAVTPNTAGIAVGNIDTSDPELEIVASKAGGGLVAYDYEPGNPDLVEMWATDEGALGNIDNEAAMSIGDINGDGSPEIALGFSVVDAQGNIWNGLNGGGAGGQRGNSANTALVDMDGQVDANGNRTLEIVAGNRVMKMDGTMLWDRSGTYSDGYPAVGDLTGDGQPNVATVSNGEVFAFSTDGQSLVFGPVAIPGGGEGGPPTIADFDGDGNAEISAAGQGRYTVYDLDCVGSNPDPSLCSTERTDGILWSVEVQDLSSSRTGSSVFDFEGDGKAEVVYNDECFLRVFDGGTGDVLFEQANSTRTGSEYPIVADVDADFNAEIVVVANNDQLGRDNCETNYANYPSGGNAGVRVYGDAQNRWVPTRTIWNQHTYHITNVLDDGAIPAQEPRHYARSSTNSFRLNVQPGGLFNAPDLVVESVEVRNPACGTDVEVEVAVTVSNQGALGVAAGAEVEVVAESNGNTETIGTVQTTKRLLPGQSETILTTWTPPSGWLQDGFTAQAQVDPDGTINECDEDNNTGSGDSSGADAGFEGLELSTFDVDASICGTSLELGIDVEITNNTSTEVPTGLPIVVEAVSGATVTPITTLRTSAALAAGATTTLGYTWSVPTEFYNRSFDVRATIDPSGEITACTADTESVAVDCIPGG